MILYRMGSHADLTSIVSLLFEIDTSFPIPLSDKTNLSDLASKLLNNGYIYMALDNDVPIGMVGFYANDLQTRAAYVSVVGVIESHRGCGVAKKMLRWLLEFCKEKGMSSCNLYTHKTNVGAIAMYQKLGFVAEEDPSRPDDVKFVKEL